MDFFRIFFISSILSQSFAVKQYMEFYNSMQCENNPHRVLTNRTATNMRFEAASVTPSPYRSINLFGMWRITKCSATGVNPCSTTNYTMVHVANDDRCLDMNEQTALDVERFGDSGMTAAQLTLYEMINFDTSGQTIFVDSQDKPRISINVRSYFFTGNNNWTLFEGEDYTGHATCLWADHEVVTKEYGVTARMSVDIRSARSLRRGCSGQERFVLSTFLLFCTLAAKIVMNKFQFY